MQVFSLGACLCHRCTCLQPAEAVLCAGILRRGVRVLCTGTAFGNTSLRQVGIGAQRTSLLLPVLIASS